MALAKITLIGMNSYDPTLFDDLILPAGVDKETLIDNILLQGGEFETVYADPTFTKKAISAWSKKWYRTIEKWVAALNISYDPLNNFDRHETYEDTGNNTSKVANNADNRADYHSNTKTEDTTNTTLSGGATTENSKSSYDSTAYSPHEKSQIIYNNQKTQNGGDATTTNGGYDTTHIESGTDVKDTTYLKHEARLWGNIGVTTSQQMLQAELDIVSWNLYEHITDLFLSEFVLLVY